MHVVAVTGGATSVTSVAPDRARTTGSCERIDSDSVAFRTDSGSRRW